MVMFRRYSPEYLDGYTNTIGRIISSVSLGAVYQSYPACEIVPMELDSIRITCEGNLKVMEIFDIGVTQKNSSKCHSHRDEKTGKLI